MHHAKFGKVADNRGLNRLADNRGINRKADNRGINRMADNRGINGGVYLSKIFRNMQNGLQARKFTAFLISEKKRGIHQKAASLKFESH